MISLVYLAISVETTANGCCTISIKGCKQQQQFVKQPKSQPIMGVTIMKLLSAITLEKELHCTLQKTCYMLQSHAAPCNNFKNQCNIGIIESCYMLHAATYMTIALDIFYLLLI